ncbi:NADH dehydrogenase (ubiquinone) 30 kDa subunit [Solidesulfovibrio carbinoliphilus subsp. oakridgensis]|uniref:NADH dehydrogenase (Ubiquinone) 30 kDa subunit n=1 Tax=Solidesulfovibrio carbinoliphilus subsp. oakridgensis TaxID=694327 RepID=G7QBU4_9BACT|nr:NADH-quinone oxidoreductase subunit C [Solidesulfovibrio carbinoliphilus]EHJ49437.1 NADH dehydrogenase (ubiquinone) 30 kDa subunit [Solidesulfovibrio carbinoliphilus subsp. oakridgensis]
MIPDFAAKLGAVCMAPMDFATTGCSLSVTLAADTLRAAVAVCDKEGYLLEDVMASDLQEGYEVAYHLSLLDGANRIVLRLTVPHDAPEVPTISDIYPGADWHERECFDFYGIRFAGHPNLYFLLLPEDTTEHPLRKAASARKSLPDLVPLSYLVDCGLAEPEPEPKAKPAPAAKAVQKDAKG